MDILGERIFRNEAQRSAHEARVEEIKHLSEPIPSAVKSVYIPSGLTEPGAISKFMLAGAGGLLAGILGAVIAFGLAILIFKIFEEAGTCLILLYYPAILVYYFAPVLIAIIAGLIIGSAGKWARSRRPAEAALVAFFWGLIAACLVFFFIEDWLIENAHDFWKIRDAICGNFLEPDSMEGTAGWIIKSIIALLSLILAPFFAHQLVGEQKFCEDCKEYLSASVIARVSKDSLTDLLRGLLEGEKEYFAKLNTLPEKDSWTGQDERLDVTHAVCSCGNTNFIEVTCYWTELKGKKDKDKTEENRLIYAAEFKKNQIEKLKELIPSPK